MPWWAIVLITLAAVAIIAIAIIMWAAAAFWKDT